MPNKKPEKLFDKIRNKIKPLLVSEDLGFKSEIFSLQIFHPSVLSKEASLAIYDTQATVDWLQDRLIEKSEELNKLREDGKPNTENLEKRKLLTRELNSLNEDVDNEICTYIEALSKLTKGEFKTRVDSLYKNIEDSFEHEDLVSVEFQAYIDLLEYPKAKFIADIFKEINLALADYNEKELGVIQESTESEKK